MYYLASIIFPATVTWLNFLAVRSRGYSLTRKQNEIRQINMAADFPVGNFSSPLAGLVRFVIKIWSRVILKRKGTTPYLIEREPWPIQKQYFWILKKTNTATVFLLHFVGRVIRRLYILSDLGFVYSSRFFFIAQTRRQTACLYVLKGPIHRKLNCAV
jgi:hypothetical protein